MLDYDTEVLEEAVEIQVRVEIQGQTHNILAHQQTRLVSLIVYIFNAFRLKSISRGKERLNLILFYSPERERGVMAKGLQVGGEGEVGRKDGER